MSHLTVRSGYKSLVERINRFPQGAPPSELLYNILEMLFSEKEAALVSQLPIKPFTLKDVIEIWKKSEKESQIILDSLSSRGLLIDIDLNGISVYSLPPPMAGFFEFSMMRIRNDVDQKVLSELFYQYLNVEEDFIRELFTSGETQIGRAFVNEASLSVENSLYVLDYERASEVINTARYIGVGVCYCRHKMQHMNKACSAPMNICMTFNDVAESLTKYNIAKKIDKNECIDLLTQAYEYNLVQFGENVRKNVNFICNCCGCCCEAMIASRRFAILHPVHTTNFIPKIDETNCNGCGKCVNVCPVEAMSLVSANHPKILKQKKSSLNEEICLGCGVCARACLNNCLKLDKREKRVITPLNSAHKAVVMAIERGKLQDLIFDNQAHWNHRVMATILGVILRLPLIKQAMASKQVKSRYLEYIISKTNY